MAGNELSRIWVFMRAIRRGAPYALLVGLAILSGANLAATIRGVTLLELQELHRTYESAEQTLSANWTDPHGVRQTLETPRLAQESVEAWRWRHVEAETFFLQPMPTK